MYIDLVRIKYIDGYRLELQFKDGKKGIIDFGPYIKKGGVYKRLHDIEQFKKAYVNTELGVLCWPDGVDFAPETLYSEATGNPLPSWMHDETPHPNRERAGNRKAK